jgi:hypothetical protein
MVSRADFQLSLDFTRVVKCRRQLGQITLHSLLDRPMPLLLHFWSSSRRDLLLLLLFWLSSRRDLLLLLLLLFWLSSRRDLLLLLAQPT